MPDISMCSNVTCILKEKCYRYRAVPSQFRQSYGSFKPDKNDKCEYFTKLQNGDRLVTIHKES